MAKKPTEHVYTDLPSVDVAHDLDAFSEAIRSQGVKLVHYSAQRCPVGMTDLNTNRNPHPHHEGCSNGFLYTKVGCITALMTSNNKKQSLEDVGLVSFSSVQCTFPVTYDDSDDNFIVANFDRFYLQEESAKVVSWELFQAHETGIDRLKYPVECVLGSIVDYRGERYNEGADFIVQSGQIKWTGRRPGSEIDVGPGMGNGFGTDRGAVCSVRYLYTPYFYCGAINHELRFTQVQDGFERKAMRSPQALTLHREYVAQNIDQDSKLTTSSDELRKLTSSMNGGMGPK